VSAVVVKTIEVTNTLNLTSRLSTAAHFVDNSPLSPAWSTVAIGTTLSLIFTLDLVTGSAPVQHLYYLPIIFAAVRFGNRGSLAAAGLAILLYHLVNPHFLTFDYQESDVVQMAVFIAVGGISAKLASDIRRLRRLATTDDLTGLHNLRSFEARLRHMVRTARATQTPLALLVLDVDRLKSLNDVHGHLAGAEAVRTVGHILAAHLPSGSAACRYGGDEFVIGLPRSGQTEALRCAEELNRAVNLVAPVLAGVAFPRATLSISVGVASRTFEAPADGDVPFEDDAGAALFRTADAALYAAKNGGRNRVRAA
jgi:diguanylate cyclase (GGDEF)-like protein